MNDGELFKMRKIIRLTLIKIGLRCDLIGFAYICTSIELAILKPEMLNSLCKCLYTAVGQQYTVSKIGTVERNMRHAIENAFVSTSFSELNKIFKSDLFSEDEKPTVGELIKLMVQYYKLGLYKNYITI